LNILAAAIKKANTAGDRKTVRAALATIKDVPVVTGDSGTFSFTRTRDAGEVGTVQIVQNGRFMQYK
jgi:ABC-type branched-subunit amino acid transport system substrate-binding protein